jgi:hypothetical protein
MFLMIHLDLNTPSSHFRSELAKVKKAESDIERQMRRFVSQARANPGECVMSYAQW